jgi:hypothetical protein
MSLFSLSHFSSVACQTRLIVIGTSLMLTVSLATTAIVMWLPDAPPYVSLTHTNKLISHK